MRRIFFLTVVACFMLALTECQAPTITTEGAKADTVAARYHYRHRRGNGHRTHRMWS